VRRSGGKGSPCDPGHGREVDQVQISGSLLVKNAFLNMISKEA